MPLIEPISREAGEHVDVEMPHVLVSGGLVVLSNGCALAAVCRTDSDSDLLRQIPRGVAVSGRQVIDVLDVGARNDEHRAVIARPPFRGDPSESAFGDGDHVGVRVEFVTNAPLEIAERTRVVRRRMRGRKHTRSSHEGGWALRFDWISGLSR